MIQECIKVFIICDLCPKNLDKITNSYKPQ